MRINQNILAIRPRAPFRYQHTPEKSTKLQFGASINRAADDAAGLASVKTVPTGLRAGPRNTQRSGRNIDDSDRRRLVERIPQHPATDGELYQSGNDT
jgi:hypothetical protein